jgi:exopolysaccharide production protein ExoQ
LTTPPVLYQREPATFIRVCPNVVLAFLALLSLYFTVWFGSLAALTFIVSGSLLWLRSPTRALNELFRFWPILVLPLWCLLTWFWSREPSATMRYGVQLGFTCLVAVAIASRLSPRNFLSLVFAIHALAALLSLAMPSPFGDGEGWRGIFGSKNAFAFTMSNFILVCLALILDRRSGYRGKVLAWVGLALGCFLLVMGQSAGALVTTILAAVLGLVLAGMGRIPAGPRLVLLLSATLLTVAIGLVAWSFRTEIAAIFLGATGKDMTLTGRTELWSVAFDEIARHPLLGQGYAAVWLPGNPVAEAMWAKFGISGKSGFHFHNTWISNAVEIGVIGVAIEAALFATALVLVWRWALRSPSAPSIFFTILMARMLALSAVEVVVYGAFSADTVFALAALVYGLRFHREVGASGRGSGSLTPVRRSVP